MKKTFNILIVGVGGQGTILASDILSQAIMNSGYDIKKNEIHGMSQRGGSVFSHIRFGKKVQSPVIPEGETDIMIALEEMETIRWLNYLNPESKLIISQKKINPTGVIQYPEGIIDILKKEFKSIITIDPKKIEQKIQNIKFLNVTILGILSNLLSLKKDAWKNSIEMLVPEGTFENNWNAFQSGKKYELEVSR